MYRNCTPENDNDDDRFECEDEHDENGRFEYERDGWDFADYDD